MSLRRLWFYPHCSVWLFQACSICATAHLMCHAPIDQVEEDHGIYGTALKVTHPFNHPPPLQLTTKTLFLIYLLIVSQDFQFPVLPSFSDSNLLMVFCSKSLGQIHHPKQLADIYCMPRSWKIPKFQLLRKISYQCQDERVRQFFLNDCLYLLLPGCDVALLLKESNRVPCFLE